MQLRMYLVVLYIIFMLTAIIKSTPPQQVGWDLNACSNENLSTCHYLLRRAHEDFTVGYQSDLPITIAYVISLLDRTSTDR